jgi:putative ABC transport system permease protein
MRTPGNPMTTISVRNLRAHKVRLLLTVISVVLGTAFVAGSFIFTDTLKGSFDKIFLSATQGIDAQVTPRHEYDAGVPVALAQKIRELPGVRAVQPEISAPAVLVNSAGKRVEPGGAPSQAGTWTDAADSLTAPPTFLSGHAPVGPNEVVVNSGAAKKGAIHTGDHVRVVLPNAQVQQVTVSGIYRVKTDTGGYIGVLFSEQRALQLLTDGSHFSALDVAAKPGVSQHSVTAQIAGLLPSTLQAKTGDQVRADDTKGVSDALSFVNYILFAFGAIGLLVGTFIIYNTFSMLIAQRLRELALLRAIGASRRQIRRSVVLEAGIVGLIGSVLGLAGGVGLAYGLHALLDALDLGLPSGGLVVGVRTIVVALVVGTAVTVLSAYAPARRAATIPPVAAMREEFASPSAASLRRRTVIGATVGALGVLVTVAGALSSSAGSGAALVGLGLVAACAGAMLLSPVLARWIIGPLGRLIGRPAGAVGRLARTNAVRNPRRTAATAFALTLGLVLVSGIAVLGSSMKASVNSLFDTNVKADYILTTSVAVQVPAGALAAAAQVPGVGSLTQLHDLSAVIDGKHESGTGVDGPLGAVFAIDLKHGRADVGGNHLMVSTTFAKDHHLAVGSRLTLSRPGGASVAETVAGVYADNQLLGPYLASGEVYRTLTPRNEWAGIVGLIKAAPGTNLAQLRTGLEQATSSYYVVKVQDRAQFKGSLAAQVNGLLGLLYGLLVLAIVIAILGIVNTLALSVVERRREIGMLRAVGMQRKQVRRTLYLESALIAVFGAVLGLGLGLVYGSLFTHALRDQGLKVLSVPVGQSVGFLVLAAVVGVLAALWPGIRAARTRPLAAITQA